MMQRINLYRDELRGERIALPAQALVYAVLGFIVLLGGVQALVQWRAHARIDATQALQARLKSQNAEVERLSAVLAARKNNPVLEQRRARLERELELRSRVLGVISGRHYGNITGFSAHLAGLGRQYREGLWLSEIELSTDRGLRLRGHTLDERLVPAYLKGLRDEPAYAGSEFSTFWMGRPEGVGKPLDFFIATRCVDKKGQPRAAVDCAKEGA